MDRELSRLETELAQSAPTVRSGSGWAALELLRRGEGDCYAGEFARYSQSSIGAEQVAWLQLLREGSFPACQPEEQPSGYQGQAEWIPLLQSAIENGNSDHWHAWLHLGVLYCAVGEWEKAEEAFRTSILRTDNGWARRNLAMVWLRAGRRTEAVEQLRQASMLLPLARIAVECGENLYKMERWQDYAEYYTSLPAEIQANDRMRLMRAFAAAELGELEYALEILNSGIEIKDLREGEPTLSDLWIRIHTYGMLRENPSLKTLDKETLTRRVVEIHPVPAEFDFRVNLD
jgi:tetratricopeptide (TPR) repeat protein